MGRFKSQRQAQRFLSAHDQINAIFRPRRYNLTSISYRCARADAFSLWAEYTAEMKASFVNAHVKLKQSQTTWQCRARNGSDDLQDFPVGVAQEFRLGAGMPIVHAMGCGGRRHRPVFQNPPRSDLKPQQGHGGTAVLRRQNIDQPLGTIVFIPLAPGVGLSQAVEPVGNGAGQ